MPNALTIASFSQNMSLSLPPLSLSHTHSLFMPFFFHPPLSLYLFRWKFGRMEEGLSQCSLPLTTNGTAKGTFLTGVSNIRPVLCSNQFIVRLMGTGFILLILLLLYNILHAFSIFSNQLGWLHLLFAIYSIISRGENMNGETMKSKD